MQMVASLGALLADVPHSRPVSVTGIAQRRVARRAARPQRRRSTRARPASSACCRPPPPTPGSRPRRCGPRCRTTSRWCRTRRARWRCCASSRELVGVTVDATELESSAVDYERQVSRAVEMEPDVQAFVERLERAADGGRDAGPRRAPLRRPARPRVPAVPAPARRGPALTACTPARHTPRSPARRRRRAASSARRAADREPAERQRHELGAVAQPVERRRDRAAVPAHADGSACAREHVLGPVRDPPNRVTGKRQPHHRPQRRHRDPEALGGDRRHRAARHRAAPEPRGDRGTRRSPSRRPTSPSGSRSPASPMCRSPSAKNSAAAGVAVISSSERKTIAVAGAQVFVAGEELDAVAHALACRVGVRAPLDADRGGDRREHEERGRVGEQRAGRAPRSGEQPAHRPGRG